MKNNEIIFDEKSGISVEEQKEILDKINGISEKNRSLLSQSGPQKSEKNGKINVNAKKSGTVFSLAVNIAALVVLIGGGLFLILFNNKIEVDVRTGTAVYNITERTLIEEIRKDTAGRIAEKEMEMSSISSRLSEVDDQLAQLYSSNQTLTAEQLATQARLVAMQTSFRDELAVLQDERAQILESSRSREARLRAQLDERAREFAAAQQIASGELDSAMNELNRLTSEQERAAAVDAQVSGGLAAISSYIQTKQYEQAMQVIGNLRHFCNNNSLASLRAFQARRDFYNQTLDFMEAMVTDARKNSGSGGGEEQFELAARNVQLQEQISEMQKTIDAASSGSSGLTNRITELTATNTTLQQSVTEKESEITSLQTENTSLSSTVSTLRSANTALETDITNLRNSIRELLGNQ
ncbi:MAG: hypothetical protein LBI28_14225 [Treponema sp.]|jgi:chromosome segregation ATPase|nr:hypothetical protein [Treponema sp.]